VFGTVFLVLGIAFWRTAADLHGHARAGAEIIVAALAQQMAVESDGRESPSVERRIARVREVLPGMGDPIPLRIMAGSVVAGRSLADVDLRSITGATVLAILRDHGEQVLMPSGTQVLRDGDLLAVIGSHDAVESARALVAPTSGVAV
jgi:monovalent cation:H+ antiporter-2, CPA2 family